MASRDDTLGKDIEDSTLEQRVIILSSSEAEGEKIESAINKATEETSQILKEKEETDSITTFLVDRRYTFTYQTPEKLIRLARGIKTADDSRFVVVANYSEESVAHIRKLKEIEVSKTGWPIDIPVVFLSDRSFNPSMYETAMEAGAFDIVSYKSSLELGNIIEAAFRGNDRRMLLKEEDKTASSLTASRMCYPKSPVVPTTPAILVYYRTPRKTIALTKKRRSHGGPGKAIAKTLTDEGYIVRHTYKIDDARLLRKLGQPNIIFATIFDKESLNWYLEEIETLKQEREIFKSTVEPIFVLETSAKWYKGKRFRGKIRGCDVLLPAASEGTLLPTSISDQLVNIVDRLWQKELSRVYMWMEAGFGEYELAIENLGYLNRALAEKIDLNIVIPDTLEAIKRFLHDGYSFIHQGNDLVIEAAEMTRLYAYKSEKTQKEEQRIKNRLSQHADTKKIRLQFTRWSRMAEKEEYMTIYEKIEGYLEQNPESNFATKVSDLVKIDTDNYHTFSTLGEQEQAVVADYLRQNILHRITATIYLSKEHDRDYKISEAKKKRFDDVVRFITKNPALTELLRTEAKINFIYKPS